MIQGVGAVSSDGNYGMLSGPPSVGASGARRREEDRWIPSGEQQDDGYSRKIGGKNELTEGEKQQVEELKKRDREVHHHEQTHAAILGGYAMGAPSYTYQVGPDGKAYAVGGSIAVDMGSTGNATMDTAKALRIRSAAGSVGGMSSADMAVSMQASKGLMVSRQA
jgi:hypothetical protein